MSLSLDSISVRRTSLPLFTGSSLLALLLLLLPVKMISAQSVGAGRGEMAGSGGRRSIQGRIYSPTGKLPDIRIRVTLDSPDSGTRTTVVDEDGNFTFNNLSGGRYQINIDAGKEYEAATESLYLEGDAPIYKLPVYLKMKAGANPALAGVPAPAVELYEKALEAARAGDTKKAIERLKAAVAMHANFGLALNELGVQYLRLGQAEEASDALRSAVKLTPDEFMPHLNYGIALMNQKKFSEAETELREALKRNDNSPLAHMYMGIVLMSQHKLGDAEKELQRSLASKSAEVAAAHRYLGGIYWGNREYKRAADELETYLKLMPKAPDAERTRAAIKELRSKQ
ncbi:MAG TPA: tetratricopeptide repeat protein [Pyrinomonadaceae bacterium]|nr:tetratricopeptide repeat protein [Pyrinomonadaceae bacterium]